MPDGVQTVLKTAIDVSRHNDPDIQHKVAYSNVAQINLKRIAISGAGRKLEDHFARALDDSATVTDRTEIPPFIGAPATRTLDVTGHTEGHATAKPRLIGVEYSLNAKPAPAPATLLPIAKEILPYVIKQLRDRRSYRQEVIENRHRRSRSQRLRRQGPVTDRDLNVIGATPIWVTQNFVSLMSFAEAFRIRTFTHVGMRVESDPAIGSLNLTWRRLS